MLYIVLDRVPLAKGQSTLRIHCVIADNPKV